MTRGGRSRSEETPSRLADRADHGFMANMRDFMRFRNRDMPDNNDPETNGRRGPLPAPPPAYEQAVERAQRTPARQEIQGQGNSQTRPGPPIDVDAIVDNENNIEYVDVESSASGASSNLLTNLNNTELDYIKFAYIPLDNAEKMELDNIKEAIKDSDFGPLLLLTINQMMNTSPGGALRYAREALNSLNDLKIKNAGASNFEEESRRQALLESEHYNVIVQPPAASTFDQPTSTRSVDNSYRTNMIKSYFQGPKHKFSGTGPNDDVIMWLTALTSAQSICKLTRDEFIHQMCSQTQGTANEVLLDMVREGLSIPDIYRRLVIRFYSKERPKEALRKLRALNWNTQNFSSLVEGEIEIKRLANLYSYKFRPGPKRAMCRDTVYLETLLNILPPELQPVIVAKEQEACTRLGRDLTISEFESLIRRVHEMIDDKFREQANSKSNKAEKKKGQNTPIQTENKKGAFAKKKVNTNKTDFDSGSQGSKSGSKKSQTGSVRNNQSSNKGHDNKKTRIPRDAPSLCVLCSCSNHNHENCPWFGQGMRTVATHECRHCSMGRHQERWCPTRRFNQGGSNDNSKN